MFNSINIDSFIPRPLIYSIHICTLINGTILHIVSASTNDIKHSQLMHQRLRECINKVKGSLMLNILTDFSNSVFPNFFGYQHILRLVFMVYFETNLEFIFI